MIVTVAVVAVTLVLIVVVTVIAVVVCRRGNEWMYAGPSDW